MARVLTRREFAQCAIDFVAARAFGGIAQRAYRRHQLAVAQPVHEVGDLIFDNDFGLLHRILALCTARAGDFAQVIHGVQEDVIELADLALDIARHRQIKHHHRPVLARMQRAFDNALADNGQRAGRATHDDVVQRQLRGHIIQRNHAPEKTIRQLTRACFGAVGKGHALGVMRGKVAGAQFDHLARTDKQHRLPGNAGIDAPGKLYRRRRHRYGAGADVRLAAHAFCHREGALK